MGSKIFHFITITSFVLSCMIFVLSSCYGPDERKVRVASQKIIKEDFEKIIVAAERIALYYSSLKGKKVACVVNHTSMVGDKHIIDSLVNLDIDVVKVFAPEHGFRGDVPDGEKIKDDIDPKTGIPIISLYGNKKKPLPEDLKGIEVVVFDIQDVGARFYTYLSTLHLIMEACAENGIKCIVLDRPNPNGHYIDGPVLEPKHSSFVGMHPVPIVYGMTIGEYARMVNGEGWLKDGIKCNLEVVELKNYTHDSFYELPIPPSPNLPNQHAVLLYPSLCFFEGTHVSVGRGTDAQFQVLGHPGLKNTSFSFIPKPNKGSKYPKHDGLVCNGEDLSALTLGSIIDLKKINLSYLLNYHEALKNLGEPFFLSNNHFLRIAGTEDLADQLDKGISEDNIRLSWQKKLDDFKYIRQKYLLYP